MHLMGSVVLQMMLMPIVGSLLYERTDDNLSGRDYTVK